MDYSKMKLSELQALAKERKIKGYSGKNKNDLIALLTPDEQMPSNIIEETPNTNLRMIDLFAGTGAFTHAFQQTGKVTCVFANDMVEASKKAYDANFGQSHKLTLGDLNDIKVENIPPHDILTGGFPCFVAGTKVLTDSGYKNIEDVDLSDRLLTHTGNFQKILNLQQKTGATDRNSVNIVNHPYPIHCTSEHPFYVRDQTNDEPKWVNASNLTVNHFSGMTINKDSIIPTINSVSLNNPDQWFTMGYFLACGYLDSGKQADGQQKNKIQFTKSGAVNSIYIGNVLNLDENNSCHNPSWTAILKEFGNYMYDKKIPEWVHSAPIQYIQRFIDGFENASNNSYTTLSENSAFGLQRLYLKLGKVVSIDIYNPNLSPMAYTITVNQTNEDVFIENSYAWFKIKCNTLVTGEPQTVYNFEVENDNSYCVENAIVHNCQPFSLAGKQEGFQDPRSNVFWKILQIIDHHKPRCVVLENVKNLVSHDDNKTFETIKKNLTDRGYHIKFKVLDTAKITGIPQHRERIYIVCMKSKEALDKFSLDFEPKAKAKISSMLETTSIPDKYYYTSASSTWPLVSESVTKKDTIYQYRRVYVRENKSDECPTLTANMGGGGHNVPLVLDNKGIRKLTPRECFNFQGFPQTYKLPPLADSGLYKLAGNAVSVPVVTLIADRLVPLL